MMVYPSGWSRDAVSLSPFRLLIVLLAVLMTSTMGCEPDEPAILRAEKAADASGDIVIGVGWPVTAPSQVGFVKGIGLAVEEINAAGGVLGRPIRTVVSDDQSSVKDGRIIAQQFVDQTDVIAVIGHLNSYISLPTSSIYQFGGLLMISPGSTSPALTKQGYTRVFRSTLSDEAVGVGMAEFAAREGYQDMVIAYARNPYGKDLANAFERAALRNRLSVVDRRSYAGGPEQTDMSLHQVVSGWRDREFSAIFIAGTLPEAGRLIREIRKHGITQPILAGEGVDSPALIDIAGRASEGVVIASTYHPDLPRPTARQFRTAYESVHGEAPDSWAARGYDTVQVLASGIREAGSTIPDSVAASLRGMTPHVGVIKDYAFDDIGEMTQPFVLYKVVRQGSLRMVKTPQLGRVASLSVE